MEMRVLWHDRRQGQLALRLGAMMFGAWGNRDHDDSIRIIHRALDSGINFIDTADVYSAGESEEIVGKALASGRRDRVVLATKAHARMGDDVNSQGSSTSLDHGRVREQPASSLALTISTFVPGPPARPYGRCR